MRKTLQVILRISFILYVLLMLWLLFGQRMGTAVDGTYPERLQASVNLIPFATVRHFLHTLHSTEEGYLFRHTVVNLAGNVIMFIPLGFFLPCLRRRWRAFFRCMGICVWVLIGIELLQLLTLLGHCDVDDLILNLAGIGIGFGIFKACEKTTSQRRLLWNSTT